MRVIAGTARSLPLKTPEGMDTRPTTDRIKETLFNMLQTYIPDCVFVDIFSGSGGIGIEALSRGARKAYFIENAPKALACIEDNLAFTKMKDRAIVLKQDACAGLTGIYEKHVDVIFMDPPYDQEQERRVLEQLRYAKYVSEETLILVEASLHTDFSYVEELGFEAAPEMVNSNIYYLKQNGVFDKIAGLWIGNYEHPSKISLEKIIMNAIGDEYKFPIIKSDNFGHIDKKIIIPIGTKAEINTNEKIKIKLVEKCVDKGK